MTATLRKASKSKNHWAGNKAHSYLLKAHRYGDSINSAVSNMIETTLLLKFRAEGIISSLSFTLVGRKGPLLGFGCLWAPALPLNVNSTSVCWTEHLSPKHPYCLFDSVICLENHNSTWSWQNPFSSCSHHQDPTHTGLDASFSLRLSEALLSIGSGSNRISLSYGFYRKSLGLELEQWFISAHTKRTLE